MNIEAVKGKLKEAGLKITPQRIAVLQALVDNRHHPSAEDLIKTIRRVHPNISVGTVYQILNTLVSKNIIGKIETHNNVIHYDPVTESHHHLYIEESREILDYFDDNLTAMVEDYLEQHDRLNDISVEDVKIQIIGKRKKSQMKVKESQTRIKKPLNDHEFF